MTPEQKRDRGNKAKRLLDDELLNESLDLIEEKVIKMWKSCHDEQARNRLWHTYQGALTFRQLLSATIQDGKLSDRDIKSKHKDSVLKKVVTI